ncbi:UNVERIFIED_CONTAM: hypothetical protein Sradi_2084300 [Sesamum radiatum]|uniref:RNase H type-1 domain-containing protein n=1 Tax=Sesamum radiatum TaxID=300843 RepID=A0AAW2THY7_SESRA
MATLSRFLSKGAERGLPFFRTLRKAEAFSWTKPPLLTKPQDKGVLYMYLATSEEAVCAVLSVVSIVIKSPKADCMEYAITLDFPASKNEAEYEAVLLGSRLVRAAGAKKLRTFSDSQLVVNQVEGGYEAKQGKMLKNIWKYYGKR